MWLLAVLAACSASGLDDSSSGPCAGGPAVEVGNGQYGHEAVEDGDVVVMVHGPQGGWHIWYSFLATNLGDLVTYTITGEDLDLDRRIVEESVSVALVPELDSDCAGESYGVFGYLPLDDPDTATSEAPPDYLVGHTLEMGVEVVSFDDNSITATSSVTVTTTCDPDDVGTWPACEAAAR
jgi:hypothetical protein